jgi:membrane protein YqaA with SNARE-associated domain
MTLLAAWWATFAICVVGAILPFINTEVYLLSAMAVAPPSFALPLAAAATAGQMVGKVALYYAGRGMLRLPEGRMRRGVAAAKAEMEKRPRASRLVLFTSAVTGFPPFYAMSVAWGAGGMSLPFFIVCGTAGRLIRFAAVALAPSLLRTLLG